MALAKNRRLRASADIDRVYKQGVRGFGRSLLVRGLKNNLTDCRAVVVVGKKVSKKAVIRNKIRRQLTGELAKLWPQLTPGNDLVVYVREDISAKPAEAAADLKGALQKSGLLKG